jgi:hypothetical protein
MQDFPVMPPAEAQTAALALPVRRKGMIVTGTSLMLLEPIAVLAGTSTGKAGLIAFAIGLGLLIETILRARDEDPSGLTAYAITGSVMLTTLAVVLIMAFAVMLAA